MLGCGMMELSQASGCETSDALHVAETGLGQVLEIPSLAVSNSLTAVLSSKRVHAGKLIVLINFEFESKLHDPFHLLKFVVVGPG